MEDQEGNAKIMFRKYTLVNKVFTTCYYTTLHNGMFIKCSDGVFYRKENQMSDEDIFKIVGFGLIAFGIGLLLIVLKNEYQGVLI